MTSRQEQERLKVLEKRREEHEQYAAERLAKVNEICKLAWLNGMSYGQYIAERSKNMSDTPNVTPTAENTPTDTPTKRGGFREPLTAEKISEVRSLIDSGATIAETAKKAGVGKSTVERIKSGTYSTKKPPKAAEPAAITTPEVSKPDKRDILRRLILEVKCCLSSAPAFEDKEEGYVLGLLTAVELILGDNAKI